MEPTILSCLRFNCFLIVELTNLQRINLDGCKGVTGECITLLLRKRAADTPVKDAVVESMGALIVDKATLVLMASMTVNGEPPYAVDM